MKSKVKGDYVGLYGRVKLTKAWCEDCQGHFIVQDGELACCGKRVEVAPEKYKRESEPEQKRKAPPKGERKGSWSFKNTSASTASAPLIPPCTEKTSL